MKTETQNEVQNERCKKLKDDSIWHSIKNNDKHTAGSATERIFCVYSKAYAYANELSHKHG